MRDYVAALLAPRDRNKTLTSLAKPVTAPHDGGALFPDDSGARKSGHATASVSHQYLGSRGQVGKGIVAAATARIVSLYGRLRGWTEQDHEPVKHELGRADFQVLSCQAIQREPPVVSDHPPATITAPRTPAPDLYDSARVVSLCSHELTSLAIVLAKGIGISLYLSP
ncbi:hypothetical protein ACFU8W_23975 [Streptomyces sp. NPDC057565]|uniref:hypothetical protein n=1 Tax=Streptomyces sp. NPDC057565 TaxID=3346169 RepID=UPI003696D642